MNPMGHHAHSQKSSSKVLKTVPPTLSHSTPPLPFAGTSVNTAYPKATLRSAEHLVLFPCGTASSGPDDSETDRSQAVALTVQGIVISVFLACQLPGNPLLLRLTVPCVRVFDAGKLK